MKNDAIESFDYFVGKVCSIHTRQINWSYSNDQQLDYFVGVVNSVNECGICLTNIVNDRKTFIMMPAVVAIAEESVGAGNREAFETSQKKYEEKKREEFGEWNDGSRAEVKNAPPNPGPPGKKPITKINDSPFVDIQQMTSYANQAKSKFPKPRGAYP
jgi:hypothetical protein